ncbi:MAG: UDP-N-acetylmuramate:L-alanyl-gamma-D-glutamyl-meso-diaminopimelate ligase [Gammaproteobacteria bacterium RIFCSPHIGHO2_12_FULL_41_15]|nr:MAG: UDP-N-acetylmuramate:L-alanyl-gamma-D-glutamyl-meso-diaminopimelate ligase [Gammaproteobacteria bacterium RIFCSPHIGHO2_12_FULL_41_15]
MRLYFLGICGTFMAGVATLARDLGHEVAGCDSNIYPPMSEVLTRAKIQLDLGYDFEPVKQFNPDLVIVGNAISRGNVALEAILKANIHYTSGPEWLYDHLLKDRHVLAVSGTHGKTTVSSILTWLLAQAGQQPGFLIGGVPKNFNQSSALGKGPYFVIEADEYDTAFFDKRPKFMHYRPKTCIINNIEFDHGDIYENLDVIKKQFGYLVRTVPSNGVIVAASNDQNVKQVIEQGCWSKVEWFDDHDAQWRVESLSKDCHHFLIYCNEENLAEITWNEYGRHNMHNALAAFVAAFQLNIPVATLQSALASYQGVKRRLEVRGVANNITVYDDFAHHPTAIAATLTALKSKTERGRVFAIAELGSNSMSQGLHQKQLPEAFAHADSVYIYKPNSIKWNIDEMVQQLTSPCFIGSDIDDIVSEVVKDAKPGDQLLVMSNKSFAGIHERLLAALS